MMDQQNEGSGGNRDRWQAVLERDAKADGLFVYGVITTGVYCRPSCPSKQASRKNVRFFDLNEEAEEAGLRPCKRCRPKDLSTTQKNRLMVEDACHRFMSDEDNNSIAQIAGDWKVSPFHFQRIFKSVTGVPPKSFKKTIKAQQMREELDKADSVLDAFLALNLSSTSRFYEQSKSAIGMRPSSYRNQGENEEVYFDMRETWLGLALVAVTKEGICRVAFGDDEEELIAGLQLRFAKARRLEMADPVGDLIERAVLKIEKPEIKDELPLDVQGTIFQHEVWQALKKIPAGTFQTYSQVAETIGRPESVRAVANACGANPVAVLVPCHRVLRKGGALGGYRWGLERKRKLLDRERTGD